MDYANALQHYPNGLSSTNSVSFLTSTFAPPHRGGSGNPAEGGRHAQLGPSAFALPSVLNTSALASTRFASQDAELPRHSNEDTGGSPSFLPLHLSRNGVSNQASQSQPQPQPQPKAPAVTFASSLPTDAVLTPPPPPPRGTRHDSLADSDCRLDDSTRLMCAHCRRTKRPVVERSASAADANGADDSDGASAAVTVVVEEEEEEEEEDANAMHCDALFSCPCGTVRYCGPSCQRAHWPLHQRTCGHGVRKLSVALDSILGSNRPVYLCQCCGRRSHGLMSCPCGEAFYCDAVCQQRDWVRSHMFYCRLVSRQELLQRVLGLEQQKWQRRTRDAATQTMPLCVSAPGVELSLYPVGFGGGGGNEGASARDPFPAPPTGGHTTSAELQLSSTAGSSSRSKLEHAADPLVGTVSYPLTLFGPANAVERGSRGRTGSGVGGLRPSTSVNAPGASYWDADRSHEMSVNEASGAAPTLLPGSSKHAASVGPHEDAHRDPTAQSLPHRRSHSHSAALYGGASYTQRSQSALGTSTSLGAAGCIHRNPSPASRRGSRFSQSVLSLRKSGYSSFFSPLPRVSTTSPHSYRDAAAGHGGDRHGDEDDGAEEGDSSTVTRHSNSGEARRCGVGFLSQQQLPSLTAFFFATRKVHLEEEAHRRAELYRQFTMKRIAIELEALCREEAALRVSLVTEEAMGCLRVLNPAAKVWKERLFHYYYKR